MLAPEEITITRTVLADLGYHSSSPDATTYTRHLDDILVPCITLDLTQPTPHARDGVVHSPDPSKWEKPHDYGEGKHAGELKDDDTDPTDNTDDQAGEND